ncbi:hypothetical protein QVD17_08759 [Tagetes erecta]|uniref:DUF4216 domain-containing protein n=1 Tax=Tagetes erecta TaxID=13708 RepID=A0AAD8P4E0_TARER|nr:hypothetical protein QVD17_08759 [Tagetes erecta]
MVFDHNLTLIDITSKWYVDEPFILANQAQQVFYLNDLARGKNWMVAQKVNHRNIYDILEHDEDIASMNDIFQEDESSELPPLLPREELPNTSMIVRKDVEPETLQYEAVVAIRTGNASMDDLEEEEEDDDDDDDDDDEGVIFLIMNLCLIMRLTMILMIQILVAMMMILLHDFLNSFRHNDKTRGATQTRWASPEDGRRTALGFTVGQLPIEVTHLAPQETTKKRVMARAKRKVNSKNGSNSTIRYHVERGLSLDSSSGQLETWRLTHYDAEKGWETPDLAAKYEEMMKLRNEHSVEAMSDKSIIEKVLGRNSVRLNGWGRDPVIASNTPGITQNSKRPTYDELVDTVIKVNGRCAIMEQAFQMGSFDQ